MGETETETGAALYGYGLNPGADFPVNGYTTALAKSCVVASGSARLYGLHVFNTNAAARYVLIFDANAVPADGAVTPLVWVVQGNSHLDVQWIPGRQFDRGIVVCNSTTNTSKTIGAADAWWDAQWEPC